MVATLVGKPILKHADDKRLRWGVGFVCLALLSSCTEANPGDPPPTLDPDRALSERLLLGAERTLDNPGTDTTITATVTSGAVVSLVPGESWTVRVDFIAPDFNVVGLGVRIGDSGPIAVFDVMSALEEGQGSLVRAITAPDNLCIDLPTVENDPTQSNNWTWETTSRPICHGRTVQLFVVNSDDEVSAPVEQQLVAKCGTCEEPTCASLLAECSLACFEGVHRGEWTSQGSAGGRVFFDLFRIGTDQVVGEGVFLSGDCQVFGTLRGRKSDRDFDVELTDGTSTVRITGAVAEDCRASEGTFSVTGGGCDGDDGAFTANKVERCSEYCTEICPSTAVCSEFCNQACDAVCACTLGSLGIPRAEAACCSAGGVGLEGNRCACPTQGDADAGVEDTGPADAGMPDSGPAEVGPMDAELDAGVPDIGPEDTGPEDTGPADTGDEDAGPPDTGVADEDGDGVLDVDDLCPGTMAADPSPFEVPTGCKQSQLDADLDGRCDPGTTIDTALCTLGCIGALTSMDAWWPAEGDAGEIRFGNDGVLLGGGNFVDGAVGLGFEFDGFQSGVSFMGPLAPWNTSVTYSVWVQTTQSGDPMGAVFPAIGTWTAPGVGQGLGLGGPNGDQAAFVVGEASNIEPECDGAQLELLGPVINDGLFHHLAVVLEPLAMQATLYVDGAAVASATTTPVASELCEIPLINFLGTTGPPLDLSLRGVVDEAQLYFDSLSPAQVQAIYNAGSGGHCRGDIVEVFNNQLTIDENSQAPIDVRMFFRPTQPVNLFVSSDDPTRLTVQPIGLIFDPINFAAPQTVNVSALDDQDMANDLVSVTIGGLNVTGQIVTFTILDDDP